MEDRETPQMHKYGESKMNYDGNCMAHHFWSRMYEISGRLIYVEQTVQHYIKLSEHKKYSCLHYGVDSTIVQFYAHHDCTFYTDCMKKPCTFQSNI